MKSLMEKRPGFKITMFTTPSATALVAAWRSFVQSQHELVPNGPWFYDLVDLSRQVLTNTFYDMYYLFSSAYDRKDLHTTEVIGAKLIEVIYDMDVLLSSNVNFLLGNWLEAAKAFGVNNSEKKLYEFNARNQITLWGPDGEILDYAAKAWGGVYSSFYLDRWTFFIDSVVYSLLNNIPFNDDTFNAAVLVREQQWCQSNTLFPTTPNGDTIAIVNSLVYRYANASSIDATYTVMANTDAPGNDLFDAWSHDIDQLKILCSLDVNCKGFNSNGWMKTAVSSTVPSSGAQLYIKN